ncbi:peptidoglycan/xylan/chitin deacetylase (PgdA/CDA1 family) [Arcticibacter tournemirensis]|uniref:Polysaccharide deacetylase family protein n=1 Tax=Arcticibacter tournemirensis TaxID=699437 RepID=A0A5M9H8X0_9SPHI|nr:glycoside hydrolase family 9 protein [Arcticibacter tournemirensis]KAA8483100.1 polysaccharide deacetylase family protein [Arcticibacter tournemirensis]TQM51987.1 peptidoglycan/xylan/chitin deacetylase (PgdA/CDA1 family) [Arcticibacter tournemirensis]
MKRSIFIILSAFVFFSTKAADDSWIRINQLGYTPGGIKVAVWVSKSAGNIRDFELINANTEKIVYRGKAGHGFGAYGPFKESYRLNFSEFKTPGSFYVRAGSVKSPVFRIDADVYKGTADFALRYMRQQRSGYNPYLKDSCHTTDGYTMYGPMPDSTRIDVAGGWHDASDYLQYSTTSANATYHLLAAYRDFPSAFTDEHQANGLNGSNGVADVLDEAKWGIEWLLKMHPKEDWLFNQLADDRDHKGMRLPSLDSVDYGVGPGKGRPVYFATGMPQGLGKYKNRATGVASTAGKFAAAFALGSKVYQGSDAAFSALLREKALSAYLLGIQKPGVCQTAPNLAPYFYEEDNWVDDMELGAAALYQLTNNKKYFNEGFQFGLKEKVTPWMGADTARHYQWYPFHNFGHYELAGEAIARDRKELTGFYKEGIENIWKKGKKNAFYRGVPFIWCSNNLTTSFAIQCFLYEKLSGDKSYRELEQANFDWLFGCNPWGTSMVYGLPTGGDTPADPHSSFTHLYKYPIDGGLVDGPVYGSIYKGLRGITLYGDDEYADFQSDLVVYHDDYGDYSTNEPTMDGTASLVYLLAAKESENREGVQKKKVVTDAHGAIIRGDTTKKNIALVFTGDEFADGGEIIARTLRRNHVKASFFFTGRFYRNPLFEKLIIELKKDDHYLGAHSDQHLLYCDWKRRDSMLVTEEQFKEDLRRNYDAMMYFGIEKQDASYFLPPYEWYNSTVAKWTKEEGMQLVNFSPGTRSTADYTYPDMGKSYISSKDIYNSILSFEANAKNGMNGFMLLMHIGTDVRRTDKFYNLLDSLIKVLHHKGYSFEKIDKLLNEGE